MWLLASLVAVSLVSSGTLPGLQAAQDSQPGTLSLRWSELGPLVQGQRVTVTLTDGRTVRGEVMAVRDDALVVDVARGSELGGGTIPRDSVTTIRVNRSKGSGSRTLGTIIGVLSGVVIGGWVSGETADSAGTGIPLFLGIATGITVAGYYAGKELDKKETVIRIVP